MRPVVLTGANGFVARNLAVRLQETGRYEVRAIDRRSQPIDWDAAVADAHAVIHLAGVNRPPDANGFAGNVDAARQLAHAVERGRFNGRVIFMSSSQAELDNPYGRSKREAEAEITAACRGGVPLAILRPPNIFGKWSRPNYNSAVATFCHNVANGLPVTVNDPTATLNLLYIDDLIDQLVEMLDADEMPTGIVVVDPVYRVTVGAVHDAIQSYAADRGNARVGPVGVALDRALYATYISFLPPAAFAYPLVSHRDARGAFSEFLKTPESGQFSYFTALPGVTRGGHYHHTKTEKFLVVNGKARFRFRHLLSDELVEIDTSSENPVVVETIPGWTHDVTNTGEDVMVSLLWANEIFDRERPDTIAKSLDQNK